VPNLALRDATIDDVLVRSNEHRRTDGFCAEATLEHLRVIAHMRNRQAIPHPRAQADPDVHPQRVGNPGQGILCLHRQLDNDRSGAGLGLPEMDALVRGLLERNTRGSTLVVVALNLAGSVEMSPDAVAKAELAVE